MTDLEKFHVMWVARAMAVPVKSLNRYYYDGMTGKFFYSRRVKADAEVVELLDSIGMYLMGDEYHDLLNRLLSIEHPSSEILEIPRLTVQQKIELQTIFLGSLKSPQHYYLYIENVKEQNDSNGFILDSLLKENDVMNSLFTTWNSFKELTIYKYINEYSEAVDYKMDLD